ncbi:hypothetical protein SAMN02744102_02664 [Paenibacillus barengoltzii]|nr:hypothetical protein SAMN02744102_02664 [Paenibacillus barengoltzii]
MMMLEERSLTVWLKCFTCSSSELNFLPPRNLPSQLFFTIIPLNQTKLF